jgi:4-amino-4-deoxy-L-arabinose transferase-like glycosyltransferase
VLLGFLGNILMAPIGEPAFRVTVLSLIAVAVAAGATVVLIRRLTGSTVIGIATGIGLATTPVVWLNATRADPHPIHLAFVALLLLALVRWEQGRRELDQVHADRRLVLAAVIFGLAAGNHSLTLLLVPPIALYVLSVEPEIWRRPRFMATCVAAAAITMVLVFLELPIRGGLIPAPLIYGKPATWDGFWYVVFAQQFHGSIGDIFANLPKKLDELVTFTNGQIGVLALAIPPALLVSARRAPRYTLLTGLALLLPVLFNKAYANADIERYYLGPVLWVWTWIGILAAELADLAAVLAAWLRSRAGKPGERALAVAAAIVAVVLLLPTVADLDQRRHAADRSGDIGARLWLAEALPAIAQNAVLVSWWSTSTPLWYAQKVEGQRPDITIIDDRTMLDEDLGRAPDVINRFLGSRPVYAIRLDGRDTDELKRQFDMTLVASGGSVGVWRVNGRLAAATP